MSRLYRQSTVSTIQRLESDARELKQNQQVDRSVVRFYLKTVNVSVSIAGGSTLQFNVLFTSNGTRIPLNDISYGFFTGTPPNGEIHAGDAGWPVPSYTRAPVDPASPNVTKWVFTLQNYYSTRFDCYMTLTVQSSSPGSITLS